MNLDEKRTPAATLRLAAYNGDITTVQNLIAEGVDVNVWDRWGRSALTFAASQGHRKVVELLLKNGAWVNPHEDYDTYQTPLLAAAEYGHIEVVRLLIAAGANPTLHVGRAQRTPEAYADQNGHTEIAEYLRQVVDARDKR